MALLPFEVECGQNMPPSGFGTKSFAGGPQSDPASLGAGDAPASPGSVVGELEGTGFVAASATTGISVVAVLSVQASRIRMNAGVATSAQPRRRPRLQQQTPGKEPAPQAPPAPGLWRAALGATQLE